MDDNTNKFLDLNGVETFSKEFFKKVDELIDGRIIRSDEKKSITDDEEGE